MVFINTDFVTFTENIYNKKYIHQYIKSYVLLFSAFSLLICPFFILFSKPILNLFEINFDAYTNSFLVLIFGVCGILTLRGLFGNLLSSIGKAHINFYITGIALLLNVASNYFLIPKYGILGASITSAALMWFTGIYSCISFLYLYRKFILNA
jgi:O-antigen/teichoic acid export membrane protein